MAAPFPRSMATGTAPVIPTSGALAATTKNTIPATPRRPLRNEVLDSLAMKYGSLLH